MGEPRGCPHAHQHVDRLDPGRTAQHHAQLRHGSCIQCQHIEWLRSGEPSLWAVFEWQRLQWLRYPRRPNAAQHGRHCAKVFEQQRELPDCIRRLVQEDVECGLRKRLQPEARRPPGGHRPHHMLSSAQLSAAKQSAISGTQAGYMANIFSHFALTFHAIIYHVLVSQLFLQLRTLLCT